MNKVVPLKHNELFGNIGGHTLPITCNSGADITVVPEDCVGSEQFTGDTCTVDTINKVRNVGKNCSVRVQVGDRVFEREAVTQPRDDDLQLLYDQMKNKKSMEEEQLCYRPPWTEKEFLQSAVMVSDGTLVRVEFDASPVTTLGPELQCEDAPADPM